MELHCGDSIDHLLWKLVSLSLRQKLYKSQRHLFPMSSSQTMSTHLFNIEVKSGE